MRLTKNFSLPEFASKDGAYFPEDVKVNLQELANNLQIIRDHFDKPIDINSGYRSPAHNERVGGAKNSYHLKGMAADIKIKGVGTKVIAGQIKMLMDAGKIKPGGLRAYRTFVHYDIRGKYKTW